jgi:dipeptidase E
MRLYLSSYRIPNLNELVLLVGKPLAEINVALIPNAGDYYAGRARTFKRTQCLEYFSSLGFKVTLVDLLEFDDSRQLVAALSDYDLIWAAGGNTFILRYEMRRSGFDDAIRSLLEQGKVYGGESAGAIVAGNSLRAIEYADNPEYAEEVIEDGLNLTPHFILPHTDSLDFADAMAQAKEVHKDDKSMITLRDSEALIVTDKDTRVVSSAE